MTNPPFLADDAVYEQKTKKIRHDQEVSGMASNGKEDVDEYGRVTKGPYTLKNGATYTGQWLN